MIKIAFPYTGTTELNQGDTEYGDYRDIQKNTQQPPELLTPENYRDTMSDEDVFDLHSQYSTRYSESIISPVEEQDEISLEDLIESFSNHKFEIENILCFGGDIGESKIYNLYKSSSDERYSKFPIKFECVVASNEHPICKLSLQNIYEQMRPRSVLIAPKKNLEAVFAEAGSIGFKDIKSFGRFVALEKNDRDKTAVIKIYSKNISNGKPKVSFLCDIASTSSEKRAGLQVYTGLGENSGLLFKNSKPQDVMYHMGTVSFPIDIIFISEDDKIKKIERSIMPGSIATFSCAETSKVLEIQGGLSSALGISEGDLLLESNYSIEDEKAFAPISKYCKDVGITNFFVNNVKYSSSKVIDYSGAKIFNIKEGCRTNVSDIIKISTPVKNKTFEEINVFYLDDGLVSESSSIKVFAKNNNPSDDDYAYSDIYRNPYFPSVANGEDVFFNVPLKSFANRNFQNNFFNKVALKHNSIKGFFDNPSNKKLNNYLIKSMSNRHSLNVFATKRDIDPKILKDIIYAKLISVSEKNKILNFEVLKFPNDYSYDKMIKAARSKYDIDKVSLFHCIEKKAGVPVPDGVKEKASLALSFFSRSHSLCDDVVNNLKQNSSEYEKLKGNSPDSIPGTKGLYNESVKRNSEITKRLLLNIRDGIKVMNEIRDISTTAEIIDSIALSAKSASTLVKEIFELISVIEVDDFVEQLASKTGEAEKILGDLKSSLSRSLQYINSDILGIVILSE